MVASPHHQEEKGPGTKEKGPVEANEALLQDYFVENAVFTPEIFRRRFKMSKELFEQIVEDLGGRYKYFH